MGEIGRAATDFACATGTWWHAFVVGRSISSPGAALGDDFGRSAAKATNWAKVAVFCHGYLELVRKEISGDFCSSSSSSSSSSKNLL
jgi:hypothetical protein